MEMIYLACTGLLLYLVSDWILQRLEQYYGRRFDYRSLYFFFIMALLGVVSFTVIRLLSHE